MPAFPTRRRLLQHLATSATAMAMPAWATAAEPGTAAVDVLLQQRLRYQGVGYLAVQVQGSDVQLKAAGRRRAEGEEAISVDDVFEVGSITKTFTALLLADAVTRKLLALNDAVEEALPNLRLRDSTGAPIRWIDLATHRSGLPRLPANMAPSSPADPYADYGEARLLAALREWKAERARDTQWAYSNFGYGLLGYALGRAAGSDYGTLLQGRVLTPLGLTQARLLRPGDRPPRLVDGHAADGKPVPHWHFDVMAPVGGLVMDGTSLARYAQAALGTVDSPLREAFTLAQREHAAGPTPTNPIGLAWLRAPLNGRTVLNHDGGTYGFSSSLWLDPSRGRATAVLANAMVEVKDLALHLLEPNIPPTDLQATRQTAVALGAEQLAPLVGVYALNPQFKLTLSLQGTQLLGQATGQQAFELFASAPRRFFARVTPLTISFDEAPTPMDLTLEQGGQTLVFKREP